MGTNVVNAHLSNARLILRVVAIAFGIGLILNAWFSTPPLELRSMSSFLFFEIPTTYWIGFVVIAVGCADVGLSSNNKRARWIASVCFFSSLYSLSYFYYNLPGSDPQFKVLTARYFLDGKLNPLVSSFYSWPGFFILSKIALVCSALPQRIFEFLLFFVVGVALSSAVFSIVDRCKMNQFFGVVAYGITGFYFLDFQFAPQTLALVLLMVMLLVEFKLDTSMRKSILVTAMFLAATISHGFLQLFYLLYLAMKSMWTRSNVVNIITLAVMYLGVNILLVTSSGVATFSSMVLLLRRSIIEFLGFTYSQSVISATVQPGPDVAIQQASRALVIFTTIISLYGLAKSWRFGLTRFDKSLVASCLVLAVAASVIFLVFSRGIQLAVVALAIGAAYFPKRSRFNWRMIVAFALVVLSFSLPMHGVFDNSLYQPQYSQGAAVFLISHISAVPATRQLNMFVPQLSEFDFLVSLQNVILESERSPELYLGRYDYAVTSVQMDHYISSRGRVYPQPVVVLMRSGNILYSNGFANIASWTTPP